MIPHPVSGQTLVDRFGEPINVGSRVVVPFKQKYTTSNGAKLFDGTIKRIVPLVEKPGSWRSTGPNSRVPWMRLDQANKSHQTEFYPPDDRGIIDDSRAYIAIVEVDGVDRALTVQFGQNLIVIL